MGLVGAEGKAMRDGVYEGQREAGRMVEMKARSDEMRRLMGGMIKQG